MAEGIAKHLLKNFEIMSAGSNPTKVNSMAVEVLKEINIDISRQYSKSINDIPKDFMSNLDYVITLCEDEICPVFISNAKKIHWPFPDPTPVTFRRVRDSILSKIKEFKSALKISEYTTLQK
jgi:arsenate reductase